MQLSVIVSTYNQPRWLEKTLWGYVAQGTSDFELVVADDGSGPETASIIERFRKESRLRLVHVWHEDRGFRKTRILNRAILASAGEYLIFSDGDCIPRDDFVQVHARLARRGRFLSGTAIHLPARLSERIAGDDIISGRFGTPSWLARNGFWPGRKVLRLTRTPWLGAVADALSGVPGHFNGNNVSVWKDALVAVNGFDHDMTYGGEDKSLGERLIHMGYRGQQIRHRAVVFHLDHARPYRTEDDLRRNREIHARVLRHREVWARTGLQELTAELEGERSSNALSPRSEPRVS